MILLLFWVGGWVGEIENKDQFCPTEVEIRTEFGNKELENGSFEETIEMRMTDLETQMTMFKTVFIRDTEKNTKPIKRLKNLE